MDRNISIASTRRGNAKATRNQFVGVLNREKDADWDDMESTNKKRP